MKSILKWIFGGSRVDRLLLAATVVAGANKKAPFRGLSIFFLSHRRIMRRQFAPRALAGMGFSD